MAVTKLLLAEQALRRIKNGNPSVASTVHIEEVKLALMQQINYLLRPRHFEALNAGETAAENYVVATYTGITVSAAYNGYSKCTLPAIPVSLLRGQGVQRVYNADDVLDTAFIPCSDAEFEMIASQPDILSSVNGQIAYKRRGKELIFNKDLTAQSPAITQVSMDLVVMDFDHYTDYEALPLDADLAAVVVNEVVKQFSPNPSPKPIDSTSDTQ